MLVGEHICTCCCLLILFDRLCIPLLRLAILARDFLLLTNCFSLTPAGFLLDCACELSKGHSAVLATDDDVRHGPSLPASGPRAGEFAGHNRARLDVNRRRDVAKPRMRTRVMPRKIRPGPPPDPSGSSQRGGAFDNGAVDSLRVRNREVAAPETAVPQVGFRCVADPK